MEPQLAMVLAIVVVLALLVVVSLVAGIAIAYVVLKSTLEDNNKPL
jgi:uncharacterized protein YneF (UPF0154 family)